MDSANRTMILLVILTIVLATGSMALAGVPDYRALVTGELFKKGPHYTESIDMMFDVNRGGELSLGTTNGSVRINTWTKNQIRLVITKTTRAKDAYNARTILEDFLVQARHKGRDLDLQAIANSETCKNSVGVTFEVWVPKDYNVAIDTGSGNVDIGKINGSFTAKTGNGKISFECDPDGIDIEVEDKSKGAASESGGAEDIEQSKPEESRDGGEVDGSREAEAGKL